MVEMLFIQPKSGEYNVSEVENYLSMMPFVIRDPRDSFGPFMLCGNKVSCDYAREKRLSTGEFAYMCLVAVERQMITIRQLCEDDKLVQSRQFVAWLLERYDCRITDDNGNDWTDACRKSLDVLYQ